MRIPRLPLLAVSAFLLLLTLPALRAQAPATAATPGNSFAERRKALNALFADYWEDNLKHDPEFASMLGDKRYNDQISDYRVKAYNAELEREQNLLMRLAAIDTAGFTEQEKISRELLLRQFAEDQEAAEFKEWEMPVNQMDGIHTDLSALVAAAELHHGQGLRRLDRPPSCDSHGL